MLHADRERLVPLPVAPSRVGVRIPLGARRAQAEERVRDWRPQKSPPVARLSCAATIFRSQSSWKLPLASVHVRVALVDRLPTGLPVPADSPLDVLAPVRLQRRLAGAEQVVGDADARRQVLQAVEARSARKVMFRFGTNRPGPSVCVGEGVLEVVEPQPRVDGGSLARSTRPARRSPSRPTACSWCGSAVAHWRTWFGTPFTK